MKTKTVIYIAGAAIILYYFFKRVQLEPKPSVNITGAATDSKAAYRNSQ